MMETFLDRGFYLKDSSVYSKDAEEEEEEEEGGGGEERKNEAKTNIEEYRKGIKRISRERRSQI